MKEAAGSRCSEHIQRGQTHLRIQCTRAYIQQQCNNRLNVHTYIHKIYIYFKTDWKFNQRQYMTFNSVRSFFSVKIPLFFIIIMNTGGWALFAIWQYRAERFCVQCTMSVWVCEFWLLLWHNDWVYEYSNSIVFCSGVYGRHLFVHFDAYILTVECMLARWTDFTHVIRLEACELAEYYRTRVQLWANK